MSPDVDATISALQWIPGHEEDVADGGHPTNSAMMQVFREDDRLELPAGLPDVTFDPVFDTWLKGDQTYEEYDDLLPRALEDALAKDAGKYRDEFGDEAFNKYRFHNEVDVSFDTDGDSVVQDSVEIEFAEVGAEPDDPTVTTGDRDNSWTVTPDHELNQLPIEESYGDGDGTDPEAYRARSNRDTRYYTYDTSFTVGGVEGVRVTTIAGGWVGYARDWTEAIGDSPVKFLAESMDLGIPDGSLGVLRAALPSAADFFLDFMVKIPRAYATLDVVVLADGRRYARVWDASAWPSVALYVDEADSGAKRRAYDKMPYEPNQLVNGSMLEFHVVDSAGGNPYSSLTEYERLLDDPEAFHRAIEEVAGSTVRDLLDDVTRGSYTVSSIMPDVPLMTVALDADGNELVDPDEPFDGVQGLLSPAMGEIEQRGHTLTIESSDGSRRGYSFGVDGNLEKSHFGGRALIQSEEMDAKSASGQVGGEPVSYEFTGAVRWLEGDGVDVRLDGTAIDPATYADEPTSGDDNSGSDDDTSGSNDSDDSTSDDDTDTNDSDAIPVIGTFEVTPEAVNPPATVEYEIEFTNIRGSGEVYPRIYLGDRNVLEGEPEETIPMEAGGTVSGTTTFDVGYEDVGAEEVTLEFLESRASESDSLDVRTRCAITGSDGPVADTFSVSQDLQVGDRASMEATFINCGNAGPLATSDFAVDGDRVSGSFVWTQISTGPIVTRSTSVTLGPGDWGEVTFQARGKSGDPDGPGTLEETVYVEPQPFAVELSGEPATDAGSVSVTATVTNEGTATDEQPIELWTGAERLATETVRLDAGADATVELSGTAPAGSYELLVASRSADDSVVIEELPPTSVSFGDVRDPITHAASELAVPVTVDVDESGLDRDAESSSFGLELTVSADDGRVTRQLDVEAGQSASLEPTLAVSPPDGGELHVGSTLTGPDGAVLDDDETTVTVAPPLTESVAGEDNDPGSPVSADGLYRDITGDGSVGQTDVAEFFRYQHRDSMKKPAYFDYSGNGRVGHADVVELFEDVAMRDF